MKKLIFLCALAGAAVLNAAKVSDVKVNALDGFGGDVSAVLARCQTRAGAEYDPVTVSRDVTSLKLSGEFQEITADAERNEDGVAVVFNVRRKMRYQAPLVVRGNVDLSESKIVKAAELKDGELYGEGDFAAAASRVRAAYQKKNHPFVKVTPVPEMIQGGNSCTLTFLVDEGEALKVRDFVFSGATEEEQDELRTEAGVYPWWNPIGWFGDEPYSADQLAQVNFKAEAYYRNLGYLDCKVVGPMRIKTEDGRADLVYNLEKGPVYRIASTKIEGVKTYPVDQVAAQSELPKPGTIAGEKTLAEAAHRVEVRVGSGDRGLADTKVEIRKVPTADDFTALDIIFVVTEGVPVVINQVRIEGNDYTKDKVLRREIKLGPGDRFLQDRAEQSQRRLENLDYFSRVRYYLKNADKGKDETGAEYRDLVYEVEEHNTGNFMVGIGASSVDSVYVSAEVSQSNFDLFAPQKLFRGAGQKGRVYVAAGPRIQTYEASVTEPYLFDRLLELTVEGYRRQRWYDDYDIIRSGASASISYPVKFWPTWDPFGRFGIRFGGEFIEFDDVDSGNWLYKGRTVSLKEEDRKYGDATEAVVRFFWSRDTRDNFRMPSSGSRTQLFVDFSGGDNSYYRAGVSHRTYWTVWEKYRHVLMANFRAETIDGISDDVPIYNRMFLGGPKSIRGIEYRGVSPYARRLNREGEPINSYDPWGGQTLACANFEYTVPIFKMLRIAGFTDIGAVSADEWDISDDFAWTVGIGFRIDIPMFPIRLDFATPIEKPSHADEEVFSFSVGYDF